MSLTVTLRNRPDAPSRLEIHHEACGVAGHIHVIAYTARPVEWSIGFTTEQAAQLAAALSASLPSWALLQALSAIGLTILPSRVSCGFCDTPASPADVICNECCDRLASCAEGALGKNTDTDSHPRATQERAGDCRLSDEPQLPFGVVAGRTVDLDPHTLALLAGGPIGSMREDGSIRGRPS